MEDCGGSVPLDFFKMKDANHEPPIWRQASDDILNDAFWNGRILDSRNNAFIENPWFTTSSDGKKLGHYTDGQYEKTSAKLDTDLFKGLEISKVHRELFYFERELEKMTARLKRADDESKAVAEELKRIKRGDLAKVLKDKHGDKFNPNDIVWPSKVADRINGVFTAQSIPGSLSGSISRLINPLAKAAQWWVNPLQDNLNLLKVNCTLIADYSEYIDFMQKDIEAMLKEIKG